MGKSTLLVLLAMGAGVAVADDLDDLLELEDRVKKRRDLQLRLQRVLNILNDVGSACLENRCFDASKLKLKITLLPSCSDCHVDVNLGMGDTGDAYVKANGQSQLFLSAGSTVRIGSPTRCKDVPKITKLYVNGRGKRIKSVELLWIVADDKAKPIFIFKPDVADSTTINYDIQDIKNRDAFVDAKVGSCQN